MEYFAHYNKETGEKQLLSDHLTSVGNLAYNQVPPTIEFDNIDNATIKDIIYYIGYFHDIGKYSNYFQCYLLEDKNSHLKNHAHISACYVYSFLSKKLDNYKGDIESKKTLLFLSYLCIRLHHTALRREMLFPNDIWKDLKTLEKHFINNGKLILDDMDIEDEISLEEFLSCFNIQSLEDDKKYLERMPIRFGNGRISNPKWYFLLIYLFSVLIDTDKLDSAYLQPKKIRSISPENVTNYLYKKHGINRKTDLINRREEARRSMLNVINNLTNEEVKKTRFFTLTAPTGIGKTLSSLQSVLRLQQRIEELDGYTPRIITAIPFINIIEQNRMEYENVFGDNAKMVVHHRLSDFSANRISKEEVSLDKLFLETESWEGDIILTTFVQLFQSMFTGENRLLKKINKLAGSIVILDEAQAIPEDYMPIIGATFLMISKYYGTRFVFMTATQPKLLEFGKKLLDLENIKVNCEMVELLQDHEIYFNGLNRTKFVPLLDKKIDNEKFIEIFLNKWSCNKSALIVVNTIKRSIQIYNKIKEKVEYGEYDVLVYYLSTNIIPLKRRKVIKEVRDLLKARRPVILVSTQTIEAGVDMDFDMGFRDFAPLDSLIQTAGRINREGEKGDNLPIYIVQFETDNHFVYQLFHRQSTLDLLTNKDEIMESEYGKLVDDYYSLALNRDISDYSRYIWQEGIIKLNFDAFKEFKLIDNIGEVFDVFIEKDDTARDLADVYEELLNYNGELKYDLSKIKSLSYIKKVGDKLNIFERKALLKLLIGKMNDYIVQVRVSRLIKNRPIEFGTRGGIKSNLYWVPPNQIEDYYDEETGFKDEGGSAYVF